VKNQFGYVKSKPESGGGANGPRQQPPISRPVPSPLPPPPAHQDSLSAAMRGLLDPRLYASPHGGEHSSSGPSSGLLSKRFNAQSMGVPAAAAAANSAFTSGSQLSSLLNCASIAELAGSAGIGPYDTNSRSIISMNSAFDKPMVGGGGGGLSSYDKSGLGGGVGGGVMNAYESSSGHGRGGMLGGGNPYERWSNGSDSLFGLGGGGGHGGSLADCGGYKEQQQRLVGSHADMLADLVGGSGSKLLSAGGGSGGQPMSSSGSGGGGGGSGPPLYPPKSQIKRQKMIYHCKFGEFGILGENKEKVKCFNTQLDQNLHSMGLNGIQIG